MTQRHASARFTKNLHIVGWPDDTRLGIGTGFDTVLINRTTALSADAELSNVIVGTSDHQGVAANSLILSNITTDGDILMLVSDGGNSLEAININAANAILQLGHGMADVAIKTAGVEKARFASTVTTFNRDSGNIGFVVNSDTLTAISVAGDTGAVAFGGNAFIGDSANANMTTGLTVNQGANDNHIFALKSSDISTGLTTAVHGTDVEVDDYFTMQKASATLGGVRMQFMAEDAVLGSPWVVQCFGGTATTNKTSDARGLISFYVSEHNGSNAIANVTADGNLFSIQGNVGGNLCRFLVDEDGDMYSTTSAQTFDDHDDLALVNTYDAIRSDYGEWAKENEDALVALRVLGAPIAEGGLTNVTQLQRLHNGAIRQLGERLRLTEQKLLALGA
jgi:hypothetical protein